MYRITVDRVYHVQTCPTESSSVQGAYPGSDAVGLLEHLQDGQIVDPETVGDSTGQEMCQEHRHQDRPLV